MATDISVEPDLNTAIRRAVAAGDLDRARQLWERYAVECRTAVLHGADPSATLGEARLLMVWCRQMALAARAQAQVQWDRLARQSSVAAAYGQSACPPPGSIRIARY